MYISGVSHTVELPLFDGSGDPITTGTPVVELSKDSAAYAAASNAAAHVDEELWTIVLTAAEATCDRYRVRVTHDDLPAAIVVADEAGCLLQSPDSGDTAVARLAASASENLSSVLLGTGHTDGVMLSAKQLKLYGDHYDEGAFHAENTNGLGSGLVAKGYAGMQSTGTQVGARFDGPVMSGYGISMVGGIGAYIRGRSPTGYGLDIISDAGYAGVFVGRENGKAIELEGTSPFDLIATPDDVAAALADYDAPTKAELDAGLAALPALQAAAVWAAANRRLSGSAPASASTALTCDEDTYATVQDGFTLAFYKLLTDWDGEAFTKATVTSITYTITRLSERSKDADAGTPVAGHQAAPVTVNDTVFDEIVSDAACAAYNFKHVIPISEYPAFTEAGADYLVVYTISPTVGAIRAARFFVRCK